MEQHSPARRRFVSLIRRPEPQVPLAEAALAVVGAKPGTPVAILADGSKRATVFAPTDQAFRLLAKDLTGKTIKSEKKIFNTLVEVAGVDTIETVLLYHVVAGKTLTSNKVLKANGANVICGGVQTANATVYLIDEVMMPKM